MGYIPDSDAVHSGVGIDHFMNDIVTASQDRLLGRLRSQHAPASRRSCKPPIIPKLQHAAEIIEQLRHRPREYEEFRQYAESLVETFTRLEQLGTPEARSEHGRKLLKELLATIELMLASVDLQSVFAPIPRKGVDSWSGDARENLIERLQRLVQYRFAACYLLHAARKYPSFRNIEVQEVRVPTNEQRDHHREIPLNRSGLFSRCMAGEDTLSRAHFERRLYVHTRKNAADVRRKIDKHIQQEKRVHAEIQLLLYYEQHPEIDRHPRIICSSKHACFLCNLFINSHGRFHIPGSHGRIYPRWRIPRFQELDLSDDGELRLSMRIRSFNDALERKIKELFEREPSILPDPNESIIFEQASQSSSLLSDKANTEVAEGQHSPTRLESIDGSPSDREPHAGCEPILRSPATKPSTEDTSTTLTRISSARTIICVESQPYQLVTGKPISVVLSQGLSVRFHSHLIHVELTYEDACSLTSVASSTGSVSGFFQEDLVVSAELVDGSTQKVASAKFDLGRNWTHLEVSRKLLFQNTGIALQKRNEIIFLCILPGTQSGNKDGPARNQSYEE